MARFYRVASLSCKTTKLTSNREFIKHSWGESFLLTSHLQADLMICYARHAVKFTVLVWHLSNIVFGKSLFFLLFFSWLSYLGRVKFYLCVENKDLLILVVSKLVIIFASDWCQNWKSTPHFLLFFYINSNSSSLARGYVARACTFTSSISTEELTPDHGSLDLVVDSGRGSWTSCSSNSHDSFQSLPASSCRPWDHGIHGHPLSLPHTHLGFKHTQLARPMAEVEPARPAWASEDPAKQHSRDSSSDPSGQVRQSCASSSSLSDNYDGNYGTVKRRNTSEHPSSPANDEGGQSTDPVYKTVTSSTERGLIGEGTGCEFDSLCRGGRGKL